MSRRSDRERRRLCTPPWFKVGVLLLMWVTWTSCLIYPHRASYLGPSSPQGSVREKGCLGFKNLLIFEYGEVRVGVTATRAGGAVEIDIFFEVPPGQVVRLAYDALDLVVPGAPTRTLQLFGRPDGVLVGGKRGSFGSHYYDGARYEIHFYRARVDELARGTSFELYLPSFSIDGQSRTIPAVRFQKRSKFLWIVPFNC